MEGEAGSMGTHDGDNGQNVGVLVRCDMRGGGLEKAAGKGAKGWMNGRPRAQHEALYLGPI